MTLEGGNGPADEAAVAAFEIGEIGGGARVLAFDVGEELTFDRREEVARLALEHRLGGGVPPLVGTQPFRILGHEVALTALDERLAFTLLQSRVHLRVRR